MIELPELYGFQGEAIEKLRDGIHRKVTGQVLSIPTGGGKTEIAKHMIASVLARHRKALFIVDRLELLDQTSRRFHEAGIDHGIISGGATRGLYEPVLLATIQTLRGHGWPEVDVVFVDECHVVYDWLRQSIRDQPFPFVGLTATPLTKGLGLIYDELVQVTTTNRLIEQDRLSQFRIRAAVEIDMEGAPLVNGEWSANEVQQRGRGIVGDIVSTWETETREHFGEPVKTMLFSSSIAHGEELCRAFQRSGIDARQVTAHDETDARRETMEAFRHGKFPIVVSVEALAKGVDIPDVKCLVIARPYRKAFGSHIQMLGRGLRAHHGKEYCLINDHSGNCIGFGAATEKFFEHGTETLDDRDFIDVKREAREKTEAVCSGCDYVIPPGAKACPVCGLERRRRSDVEAAPGTMITLEAGKKQTITIEPVKKGRKWSGTPGDLWNACCGNAERFMHDGDSGRAMRRAKAHYRNLTNEWPPYHYQFERGHYVPKTIQRRLDKEYREWKKRQDANK